jgi:hypothetical protein
MDYSAVAKAIAEHYTPPRTGRPSDLSDIKTVALFLSELESGVHLEPAAELAGLAPNTVRNWIKRGEAEEIASQGTDSPYQSFCRAVKRCRANAESRVTKNILKASEEPRFWAAGATYLERTYPDRWGRRQEDSSSPRIVVQIGARDSDVSVQVSAVPVPVQEVTEGNHNRPYQTQIKGEPEE